MWNSGGSSQKVGSRHRLRSVVRCGWLPRATLAVVGVSTHSAPNFLDLTAFESRA